MKWLKENRLLTGFLGLSITSGTAAGIMQLVLPLYAMSLNIGDAGIGLIRGLLPFGGIVTTMPGGFLIDRFGSRKVYMITGLLDVMLILLITTATNRLLLMAYLFLEGGVATVRWTAMNSSFIERLHFFGLIKGGWMRASMTVGFSFVGPLLGGQLVQSTSYTTTYGVMATLIFLPLCFMLCCKTKESPTDDIHDDMEGGSIFAQFRQLMKNRLLLRTGVFQSLAVTCYQTFMLFIIILIVKNLNQSPRIASLIIASQGVGAVLVMLWGGNLTERFSMQKIQTACCLMQIAGLLAAGFSSNLLLIGAGAVVLAMGAGLIMTTSYSQLGGMRGKKGKISAFFFLIVGTGTTVGPVYSGYLSSLYGIRAAFTGFIPVEIAALCFIAWRWSMDENMAVNHARRVISSDQENETALVD